MPAVARQFSPREILIHTPDGKTRALVLERDRYTLGRSSANELCYSEDAGLSQQHMVLERNGETWTIRDLNSKNGTFVNGMRIHTVRPLGANDHITPGHLTIEFADKVSPAANTVIFVEGTTPTVSATTVSPNLDGLLSDQKAIGGRPQMHALIRAGRHVA